MSPTVKAIARGAAWTLFYYLLILAIFLMWQGSGLFIYEGF